MPIPAWRAAQTTNTTGTGTVVLNAAPTGRRSFQAAFGSGSSRIGYVIQGTTFWEVGLGDFDGGSPGNLTRATVLASSNSNALVSLPAGTADVFAFLDPASRALVTGTGGITLALADLGNLVAWSGSSAATVNLPAIATVPQGQGALVVNGGAAALTIDPSGAEQINGAATLVLLPGEAADCYRAGAAWVAAVATPLAGFSRIARFTASGSWTVPSGITRARVRVWGGGGGGGGNGTAGAAGGGGGGGYAEDVVTGLAPGASIAITVGAAGTAGANTGSAGSNNGGTGGTSSFGASLSATGGTGGGGAASSAGAAGVGGSGSGGGSGAILATGGSGSAGTAAGAGAVGGRGGEGAMGGGGGGTSTGSAIAGAFPGGGGGGGAATNPGQPGAAGLVVIEY
jgi:hypothetical protein